MNLLIKFLSLFLICTIRAEKNRTKKFPDTFEFGVGTSSYQIEGAWDAAGKSPNIWDYATHNQSEWIVDGSTADIACDSYNKLDDDIRMLKYLGVHCYRFSVSWSRLFPMGYLNEFNMEALNYYNRLIDKLIENNIKPMVTMYHWDLPQYLQDLGGWANPIMVEIYANYAERLFEMFGDRVKTWVTFNEPTHVCKNAYNGKGAPFLYQDGVGTYLCGHTLIKAHAKAFRIYERKFKKEQMGEIGMIVETDWYEPHNQSSKADVEAVEFYMQMNFNWFVHPIYSKSGDYPEAMKTRIDSLSKTQGFKTSRLPKFTKEEIDEIRGSYDFMGLNHYTTFYATPSQEPFTKIPSYANDLNISLLQSAEWPETGWSKFRVVPWGIRKLLKWIDVEYGHDVPISITENGFAGGMFDSLNDTRRIRYIKSYLQEVLNAIDEGCNVNSYSFWSLMDNFEWARGYTIKFGLFHVDFQSKNRTRTPKSSATVYKNIIATRTIDLEDLDLKDQ